MLNPLLEMREPADAEVARDAVGEAACSIDAAVCDRGGARHGVGEAFACGRGAAGAGWRGCVGKVGLDQVACLGMVSEARFCEDAGEPSGEHETQDAGIFDAAGRGGRKRQCRHDDGWAGEGERECVEAQLAVGASDARIGGCAEVGQVRERIDADDEVLLGLSIDWTRTRRKSSLGLVCGS